MDDAAKDKVKSLIKSGREDGFPDDEKIKFTTGEVVARNLIPCQKQLLLESSIKHSLAGKSLDSLHDMLKGRAAAINNSPVVTLNGKYIIDGHHRWVEAYIVNPNTRVIVNDMKINVEPIEALKIIQLAIAANSNKIPTSSPEGTNLYDMSEEAFKSYVKKNVTETVLDAYTKSKDELADYMWNNVLLLRKSNQPIKDAPDRVYMPQPAKAPGAIDDLEKGVIDFKEPFAKEESANPIKKNLIPTWDEFVSENYGPESELSKYVFPWSKYNTFLLDKSIARSLSIKTGKNYSFTYGGKEYTGYFNDTTPKSENYMFHKE
jgi:hypothetical protein